jgi:E3 ubiquitin-protein ligase HERC3
VDEAAMCALLNTAELKCWGRNEWSVLGIGTGSVSLPTGKTVVSVSGTHHTIVMFDDHTMTGWGRNDRLGIGGWFDGVTGDDVHEMGDNMKIINIGTGRKPVQVKVVDLATVVLLDNGDVIAFGENHYGILGNGISHFSSPHYLIGDVETEMGDNLQPIDLGFGVKVRALISKSPNRVCVVTTTNQVKCWGMNLLGQLGIDGRGYRGDGDNMGDKLPFTDLGRTIAPCAGIEEQPVCIACVDETNCCPDGQYWAETTGGCQVCPMGSYCAMGGRTDCPGNASSVAGSVDLTDCACMDGYFKTSS